MQNRKQRKVGSLHWKLMGMPKANNLIIVVLLVSLTIIAEAQTDHAATPYFRLPIRVSFGSQAVGFPYQNLFSAFNPSFSAGTEFRYNKNETHRICQTLNVGFSVSDQIGSKVMLNSDFCYRYTHSSGVFADISIGLGLLNQFHARKTYQYNSSTGEYDKVKDYGTFGLMLGYGMSLGYDFSRKNRYPVSIFVKNTFYIQSPYFDMTNFPIMPQSTIQIGLTVKIRKHEK
ncbi:MAG: hypothetical protein NTW16_05235 [Bacteroidetes bacterium]|nr:hypothetical protein [Bacteroidota bacterium]